MRPHDEAQKSDCGHRVDHRAIAEDRLAREDRQDIADHSHRRQNHDVDGRVRVKPEQVLMENGKPAAGIGVELIRRDDVAERLKEAGQTQRLPVEHDELVIQQVHQQGACQHGRREEHEDRRNKQAPHGKRHAEHGHAGRAKFHDRRQIIHRAHDAREAQQEQTQKPARLPVPCRVLHAANQQRGGDDREKNRDAAVKKFIAELDVVAADVSEPHEEGEEVDEDRRHWPGAVLGAKQIGCIG